MVGSITYHHLCWWSHHFSWANPIVNPTFLQILPRILSPFVVFFYRFFPIFSTDFMLPGHQLTNFVGPSKLHRVPDRGATADHPHRSEAQTAAAWIMFPPRGWVGDSWDLTNQLSIGIYIYLKRMEYDMDFQDTSKIGARLKIPYGICSRRNIYCIYIYTHVHIM